jgi:hypothetical protein
VARRLTLGAVLAAAFVVVPAGGAQAHTGTYCGHGLHWHKGSRTEFVKHGTVNGRHTHLVFVAEWPLRRHFINVVC